MKFILFSLLLLSTTLNGRLVMDYSEYPDTTVYNATNHTVINDLTPEEADSATRVSGFGDQKVNSGYAQISDKSAMYFLLSESLDGNADAPLVLWLQGGPGCSSQVGNYYEIGPQELVKDDDGTLKLVKRDINWNQSYHLLFIDQPVGTGFSYVTDDSAYVSTQDQVAADLHVGLLAFFKAFPQFTKNDFFIFGESYAGKYIPAITKLILETNETGSQDSYIGLTAIGIGDGTADPIHQLTQFGNFGFANGLIDLQTKATVDGHIADMVDLIEKEQYTDAHKACGSAIDGVIDAAGGINQYNFRRYTPYPDDLFDFLNQAEIKQQFHIPDFVTYHSCSHSVGHAMSGDRMLSIIDRYEYVVEKLPMLLYTGQNDFLLNIPGADTWISHMEWSHKDEFHALPRVVWNHPGTEEPSGYWRTAGNLYQAVVIDSGHMVPRDKPDSAKEVLDGFIATVLKKKKEEAEKHEEYMF